MFFVFRHERYHPVDGMTFRTFLNDGWKGERATMADFELHLSTLFPEVRIKKFIECRSADGGPREMTLALPAFWKGLFYDQRALEAADQLTAKWTRAQVIQMQRAAAMDGIRARGSDWFIGEIAHEILGLSRAGLERLNENEAQFLAPLEKIVSEGQTRADYLMQRYLDGQRRWTPSQLECVI